MTICHGCFFNCPNRKDVKLPGIYRQTRRKNGEVENERRFAECER